MLMTLANVVKVHLDSVKAHVGTAGNERADKLAKAGAKGAHMEVSSRTNLTGVKMKIKKLSLIHI